MEDVIVIISENPDPRDPIRKDIDIEVRILIKGATDEEGERIGQVIGEAISELRPNQKIKAFQTEGVNVS